MAIDWERFPKVLKAKRQRRNITQVDLANRVGVQWNTISRLEFGNRRPSFDLLEAIANALECRVADLLPETGDPLPKEPAAQPQPRGDRRTPPARRR